MARYERKDHLYNQAKVQGVRSRAYYKLKELQKKYRFIKPGYKVVDLGAWPGGWVQGASELVGAQGLVIGLDLVPLEDFDLSNIKLVEGDVYAEESVQQILTLAGGKCNVLLSDMAPKLTGIKEADSAAAVALVERALKIAEVVLQPGGSFVAKVFKGNDTELFVKSARKQFKKCIRTELASTRKGSSEYYMVGLGFCV